MVYRQYKVRVPEAAHPQVDGRVLEIFPVEGARSIRRTVGQMADDGTMYPSSLYFSLHPNEWKEQYPDEAAMLHRPALSVGLFALVLGIAAKLGIYQVLCSVYGPEIANGIMDYVMYLLYASSTATCSFESKMNDHLLFSVMPHNSSWYSRLWSNKMTEQQNNIVRAKWLKACISNGIKDVYLSIDGTNMDYVATNNELSAYGHDKSKTGKPIVACMWAVCASGPYKGLPLTYFVTDGNIVDNKAVIKAVTFLRECGINVHAILADKGFCTKNVFDHLKENGYDFVIMLKRDTYGFETMLEQYGNDIPNNMEYSMEGGHKFGLVKKTPILKTTNFESYVALVYDTVGGAIRRDSYLSDAYRIRDEWNETLENGRKSAKIPAEYSESVQIDPETKHAYLNKEHIQKTLDRKGFYGLGTTLNRSASELDDMRRSRDSAEKSFIQLKTFLGFHAIRVHFEPAVLNLFQAGMIATIIRSELVNSCKRHNLMPGKIINEAARYKFEFVGKRYSYCASPSISLSSIFADFDINEDSIQSLQGLANLRYQAEEENDYTQEQREIYAKKKKRRRINCVPMDIKDEEVSQIGGNIDAFDLERIDLQDGRYEYHLTPKPDFLCGDLPRDIPKTETVTTAFNEANTGQKVGFTSASPNSKRGRKPKVKTAQEKPKGPGRGRVKGSKNKKTLERERLLAEGKIQLPPRKPRGRPRNPRNIKAEDVWAQARTMAQAKGLTLPEKRGKGRPSKWVADLLEEARAQLIREATDPPA